MLKQAATITELVSLGMISKTSIKEVVKVDFNSESYYFITAKGKRADAHKIIAKQERHSKEEGLIKKLKSRIQIEENNYEYILLPNIIQVENFIEDFVQKEEFVEE